MHVLPPLRRTGASWTLSELRRRTGQAADPAGRAAFETSRLDRARPQIAWRLSAGRVIQRTAPGRKSVAWPGLAAQIRRDDWYRPAASEGTAPGEGRARSRAGSNLVRRSAGRSLRRLP